jgi:hypothetical protein
VGVDPKFTGLGAIDAAAKVLERAGLTAADIDLWEINEAFASVPVAACRVLGLDEERVNVHGSGCSLGHPIAASGARMVTTLVHELRRRGGGVEFVLNVLACWKLGAVPIPVRWDLPDWELTRVREVIDPKAHLGPGDIPWIQGTAQAPVPALPNAVSPHVLRHLQQRLDRDPKVIMTERPALFDARGSIPFAQMWQPVPRPQTILVPAPMYHTNGFTPLITMLSGDRLVIMGEAALVACPSRGCESGSVTPMRRAGGPAAEPVQVTRRPW